MSSDVAPPSSDGMARGKGINMKNFVAVLSGIGALLFSPASVLAQIPVSENAPTFVAVPGNVFASLDKGAPRGIFIQAMDAVLRQMGKTPSYVSIPTGAVFKSMEEGKLHVGTVVIPLARDAERAWFSDPILREYSVVAVLNNKGFRLDKVADLDGKSVGARLGYLYPMLEQDARVKMIRYRSDGEMIRALLFGEVNAVLLAGMSDIRSLRNEGVISKIEILDKSVGSVPLVAVFSRKTFTPADVETFNRLMAEFRQTPAWQAILNQNGFADLIRDWPMVSQ